MIAIASAVTAVTAVIAATVAVTVIVATVATVIAAVKAEGDEQEAEASPEAETPRARREPKDKEKGGRDRGRSRGGDKRGAAKSEDKPRSRDKAEEKPSRTKRDTAVTPPPAAVDGAQARLFISLGKKHGVSADDLRALLAGPVGGDKERIGSVSLRDSHAHVRVPEELVDAIIAGVHGTQHNEHDVTVERARV